MGHIAKPDFIIAFGEDSAIDVKFSFYLLELISSKELPVEEAYSWLMLPFPRLQNHTAIITLQ